MAIAGKNRVGKASDEKASGVKPPPRLRRSFGRRLLGAIGWTCCIAVILYGAAQALSRTAGFRSLLADRLSDRLGIPLTIGASRMDARLNVTLEDIMTKQEQGVVAPEVGAERVEIRWNWGREPDLGLIRSLTVDGGLVRLVQDKDGAWSPACLAPLADKVSRLGQLGMLNGFLNKDAADAVETPPAEEEAESAEQKSGSDILGGLNVIIRNAQVTWWSGDREVASIEGLDFLSRQVDFSGRRVQYYQVKANEAGVTGGRRMQNISFEMLSTAGRNIVLSPKASLHAVETEAPSIPRRSEDDLSLQEAELLAHAQSAIERSRELEGVVPPPNMPTPVMEVPTVTPWPTPIPLPTATPWPTATPTSVPTPTPVPTPVVRSWPTSAPAPVSVIRRVPQQEVRPTPTVIPDPMEQAMEAFAAAQRLTNAPGAAAAPEGLSDEESEALIRYIKEMLESGN